MNARNSFLTPRMKRYGIVLGTALTLLLLIFVTSKRQTPDTSKTNEASTPSVDFTGVPPKELTLNRISADLERIHQQQKTLHEEHQQEMDKLQHEIDLLSRKDTGDNTMNAIPPPEPEPVPDVLSWNQYNPPPPVFNNEPDYYESSAQSVAPRTIRMLGATPPAVPSETKPKDQPKLLRLPAGSLLSGQLITGLDVPTGQGVQDVSLILYWYPY